jgi:UvrD-like helicase C-terminal domain/Type III restriction enzyme, res subunit
MALFIPEWIKVSGKEAQIRHLLLKLDDAHIVRRPLRCGKCPADLFIEHKALGWLALAIEDIEYETVAQNQLFDSQRRTEFEERLQALQQIGLDKGQNSIATKNIVPTLIVMRRCSANEVKRFATSFLVRYGVRIISNELFTELGIKLIGRMLAHVALGQVEHLMVNYFPEAEIAALHTTRRFFERNNNATLGKIFLDTEQEWAAKLDLDQKLQDEQFSVANDFGVRLVNGIAGSGKTLIAINRALLLSELYPKQRIVILIHNTPIVADINAKLRRTRGELPPNLEIETFFGWVCRQWRRAFNRSPQILDGKLLVSAVEAIRARQPDLKLSTQQLIDEFDFINQSLIYDEPSYLQAPRIGRGFSLRMNERDQVWQQFAALTEFLLNSEQQMWSTLPATMCATHDALPRLEKFHHVLIDEAQFFAASWFEMVKHSMQQNGKLFLCADPNQGFMKSRLSWKSVGLNVVGKTKRLHKSYRTTRAILEAANQLLRDLRKPGSEDYLEPVFDGMPYGVPPSLIYVDSPRDALDRLANEVAHQQTESKLPLSTILVIYGENLRGEVIWKRIRQHTSMISVWWFNEKTQKKFPPDGYDKDYLRMAYLDSATGLEGAVVFLIGMEDVLLGNRPHEISNEEWTERQEESKRKLYMAMTRAGQRLVLITSSKLPYAIESLFELVG